MILYIDTTKNNNIYLALKEKDEIFIEKTFEARFRQSEMLLPEIEKMLNISKKKLNDLSKIVVENRGESFTSLRIGVITANVLAYALGINIETIDGSKVNKQKDVNIVEPKYNREPNIT